VAHATATKSEFGLGRNAAVEPELSGLRRLFCLKIDRKLVCVAIGVVKFGLKRRKLLFKDGAKALEVLANGKLGMESAEISNVLN
jgi:hypothetical protein